MVLLADPHQKRSCLARASACFWTQCTEYLQQVTQSAQFQPGTCYRRLYFSPVLGKHLPVKKTGTCRSSRGSGYGCQCLGFLTRAQTLMHAIAHEGCTGTGEVSALKVDSGEEKKKKKILAATGTRTCVSISCAWLCSRTLYQLKSLILLYKEAGCTPSTRSRDLGVKRRLTSKESPSWCRTSTDTIRLFRDGRMGLRVVVK